jgi:polyisoprenoid-binding protein YceI
MSTVTTELSELLTVAKTRWRIDPARSSIEFRTPTLWGLATVKGRFDRYEGTLDLDQDPAIALTIDAGSLDTKNKLRDKHLVPRTSSTSSIAPRSGSCPTAQRLMASG